MDFFDFFSYLVFILACFSAIKLSLIVSDMDERMPSYSYKIVQVYWKTKKRQNKKNKYKNKRG